MADAIPTRKKKKPGPNGNRPPQLRVPHHEIVAAEVAERQRQALEFRKLRMTYDSIGKAMVPPCTAMSAWRYVQKALAAIPREAAEETKRIEIEDCYADLKRLNKRIASGLTVIEEIKALGAKAKLREQLARYFGHYAPARTELTGKDGAPLSLSLTQSDIEAMSDEQIDRAIDAACRRSGGAGTVSGTEATTPGTSRQAH